MIFWLRWASQTWCKIYDWGSNNLFKITTLISQPIPSAASCKRDPLIVPKSDLLEINGIPAVKKVVIAFVIITGSSYK